MEIYILTVNTEDDSFIMPFSTYEKAATFVRNNFQYDVPRELTKELFEGRKNHYMIDCLLVDQERF